MKIIIFNQKKEIIIQYLIMIFNFSSRKTQSINNLLLFSAIIVLDPNMPINEIELILK